MSRIRIVGSLLLLVLALGAGCRSEGEAERLGRQLDDAADRMEDEADRLADEAEEKAEELEEAFD